MKTFQALCVAASAAISLQAFAQAYPSKPVHVVITFGPGTATDIVGRVVTQKLSEFWNQPVVVDTRTGAGGAVGSGVVARSAPDGYTLLINSNSHTINPAIYAKLPYDTLKDFVNIAPLAGQPNVLIVEPGSSIKSVKDFVAAAKANPGKINFASAGTGSGTHLNLEKFKVAAGINVVHIPYKGSPDIFADILGRRVDTYFAPISAAISFIREGKFRALAVSSAKRSAQLPDVPTLAEAGVAGSEFTLWFGVWGPAGIPADIVDKIGKDVNRALGLADVRERLAKLGNETMSMMPAEFARFVRAEIEDVMRITRAAGLKPQ